MQDYEEMQEDWQRLPKQFIPPYAADVKAEPEKIDPDDLILSNPTKEYVPGDELIGLKEVNPIGEFLDRIIYVM